MPDDVSAVFRDMQVPGTNVFFLGCQEKRVTVLAQQHRALNLADALLSSGRIRLDGRVAVVGGGAGGLTAAAALLVAAPDLRVDLLERAQGLMHLQQGSDRALHPHIYDWPADGATEMDAGLPFLTWSAGPARAVAKQIVTGFEQIAADAGQRLDVQLGQFVSDLVPTGPESCRVQVEGRIGAGVYDAVILAIGFGYERRPKGHAAASSYWTPTQLLGPFQSGDTVLISGNGDGGLVDFAVAALNGLTHDEIVDLVVKDASMSKMVKKLRLMEREIWSGRARINSVSAFETLEIPDSLLLNVFEKMRKDINIWFHTREVEIFKKETALINRLTAFLLMQADQKFGTGNLIRTRSNCSCVMTSKGLFRLGTEKVRPQIFVPRFGPDSQFNLKPFGQLYERLVANWRGTVPGARPALPPLTPSARVRFGPPKPARGTASAVTVTVTPGVPAPSSRSVETGSEARRWLLERGVALNAESLRLYIQSGAPSFVTALLEAGMFPDMLLGDRTPLRFALDVLRETTSPGCEPEASALGVVAAIVAVGPRGVAREGHDALQRYSAVELVALLRAGIPLDAKDDTGQSLAARAMRIDDWRESPISWVNLLVREATAPLLPDYGRWLLLWAAARNNKALVERLLDLGIHPDTTLHGSAPSEPIEPDELRFWRPGGTALHQMLAATGTIERAFFAEADRYSQPLLRLLLDRGASVLAKDSFGQTPLHIAAYEGFEIAASLLIDAPGGRHLEQDLQGCTPLDRALMYPRSSSVALAIVRSFPPLDQASLARALHGASNARDVDVIEALLDAGADPNIECDGIPSALFALAREANYIGPVTRRSSVHALNALLSRGACVMTRDARGWTPLHWIVRGPDLESVERLLTEGAEPDAGGVRDETPLMGARTAAIAQRLLAAGADPYRQDVFGYRALDHATLSDRTEVTALLVNAQDQPNQQSELVQFVVNGNVEGVRGLLDAGADPNTLDLNGTPILGRAAARAHVALVDLLVGKGADADARSVEGRRALDECLCAFEVSPADQEACLTLLLDHGASVSEINRPGGIAAAFRGRQWWGLFDIAARLCRLCAGERGRAGETLLMMATERGTMGQVLALLEDGAPPDDTDDGGRTALHYAVAGPWVEDTADKVRALVKHGADLEAATAAGDTPLLVAAIANTLEHIDLLLEVGADRFKRNRDGYNLASIVLAHGDTAAINKYALRDPRAE